MRWAGPVSRRSRQTIITQKKWESKFLNVCGLVCLFVAAVVFLALSVIIWGWRMIQTSCSQILLIPDVLLNGLNFVSLHGPLVSLRGLKKNDRVITSLFTARTKGAILWENLTTDLWSQIIWILRHQRNAKSEKGLFCHDKTGRRHAIYISERYFSRTTLEFN